MMRVICTESETQQRNLEYRKGLSDLCHVKIYRGIKQLR